MYWCHCMCSYVPCLLCLIKTLPHRECSLLLGMFFVFDQFSLSFRWASRRKDRIVMQHSVLFMRITCIINWSSLQNDNRVYREKEKSDCFGIVQEGVVDRYTKRPVQTLWHSEPLNTQKHSHLKQTKWEQEPSEERCDKN